MRRGGGVPVNNVAGWEQELEELLATVTSKQAKWPVSLTIPYSFNELSPSTYNSKGHHLLLRVRNFMELWPLPLLSLLECNIYLHILIFDW